ADHGIDTSGNRRAVHVALPAVLLRELHCYHQQYLSDAKNPNGYCGIGGTGVCMSDPSESPAVTQHPVQPSNH
ncbi:MAG TPA: hypothetical protein VF734_06200, partial [Pseudonocardiaceae bacterium]